MKRSVQIWRGVLAVLMTLAVFVVWPPRGSEALSSTDHAAITASHSHHAHAEEISPQPVLDVTLDADCQLSAIGCCMMTHCHLVISVAAHEMTNVVTSGETRAATPVRGLGSDPGMILPPPRRSWI